MIICFPFITSSLFLPLLSTPLPDQNFNRKRIWRVPSDFFVNCGIQKCMRTTMLHRKFKCSNSLLTCEESTFGNCEDKSVLEQKCCRMMRGNKFLVPCERNISKGSATLNKLYGQPSLSNYNPSVGVPAVL